MSLLHAWRRSPGDANRNRPAARTRNRRRFVVEAVEERTLLSTILWTNRGGASDSDNFNATYGANANTARAIVDAALRAWQNVILNFNYANGGNTFSVNIRATNLGGGSRGEASNTAVDASGKPTGANIRLDDNGGGRGWFFDATPNDNGEFTDLVTRFTASFAGTANDFYRTITHELGHALGISRASGLAINNFLTPRGADPNDPTSQLFLFNAGTTRATLTSNGGAHLYEGPANPAFPNDPIHPNDLLNSGRTIDAPPTIRQLITDTDALVLRDAYGYSILLPSTRQTFLANFSGSTNTLTINGDPQAVNDAINLDAVSLFGIQIVTVDVNGVSSQWLAPSSVVVRAGAGIDTINVRGTSSVTSTTIFGEEGADAVTIGDAGGVARVRGAVLVVGGSGTDNLTYNDSGGTAASATSLTSTTISRSGVGTISYVVENLTLSGGSGDDSFNVTGSNPGTAVSVLGLGGADSLTINDSENSFNYSYALTSTSVSRVGASTISYSVENLVLTGGNFDDTFDVTSSNPGTAVSIYGLGGNDTININDYSSTANNTYTLSSSSVSRTGASTISFAVERVNLTAGSGDDTFKFNPGGAVPGVIFAGDGFDTLDYSSFGGAVVANLETGATTGVGAISSINSVRGSAQGDTLTGGGDNDVLVGNGGDDTINGGGGRDVLIGGAGFDTLNGGNGEDIVIGAATVYDADAAALKAILAEWGRSDATPYQTRVDHLRATLVGGLNGSTLLDLSKTVDDALGDSLTGGAELDWFFGFVPPDVVLDRVLGEVVN